MSAADVALALLRSRYPVVARDQRLAAHQHAAVLRILRSLQIHRGVLLADDVGLGKSWVAAAAAAEWQRRGSTCEFVVPAALIGQWRGVLARFSVKGAVRSHDSLLSSSDSGPPPELIVVDEAHRFRNRSTLRYTALARRASRAAMLLLTATPVANRLGDLAAILRLFAPDDLLRLEGVPSLEEAFGTGDRERISRILEELVIRRDRAVLPPSLQFGDLTRQVVEVPPGPDAGRIENAIRRLSFPLIGHSEFLRPVLRRRLESSEAALRATLVRQRRFYRRALEALAEGSRVTKRDIMRIFGNDDSEVYFQDLLFKPLWFGGSESQADFQAIQRELDLIEELLRLFSDCPSPKRDLLLSVLGSIELPAIVYTSALATARDLLAACERRWKCGLVTSGESKLNGLRCDTARVFASFQARQIEVLICTDIGAEGLNLQQAASVVHYDLPWNPVRIDQRNGRAHRIGQKRHCVRSVYFLPPGPRRHEVFVTLTRKKRMRSALLGTEGSPAPSFGAHEWDDAAIGRATEGCSGWWTVRGHRGAIVLVERGGNSQRRRIIHMGNGRWSDQWRDVESWVAEALQQNGSRPQPAARPRWVGSAESALEAFDRARAVLPEAVAGDSRSRWLALLQKSGMLDERWRELLGRSWRAGIEALLEDLPSPDAVGHADEVRAALEAECMEHGATVRIVGGLL